MPTKAATRRKSEERQAQAQKLHDELAESNGRTHP